MTAPTDRPVHRLLARYYDVLPGANIYVSPEVFADYAVELGLHPDSFPLDPEHPIGPWLEFRDTRVIRVLLLKGFPMPEFLQITGDSER